MTGAELLRHLRRLARRTGATVSLQSMRGKGSHVTLHFGERSTIIPNPRRELRPGTLRAILRQLGIPPTDLH